MALFGIPWNLNQQQFSYWNHYGSIYKAYTGTITVI